MSDLFKDHHLLAAAQVGVTIIQTCSIKQIYRNNDVSTWTKDYANTKVPT